jgi:hypothetical protein
LRQKDWHFSIVMEPEVEAPERARGLVSLAQPRYCQGCGAVDEEAAAELVVVLDGTEVDAEVVVVDEEAAAELVVVLDGAEVDAEVVVVEAVDCVVDVVELDETTTDDVEVRLAVEVEFKALVNSYICSLLPAPQ